MTTEFNPISKAKPEEADDTFMVSYSALMILLLTFMILMVTLSTVKEPRFREAIGSVQGALSFMPHEGGGQPGMEGQAGFLPEEMLARASTQEIEQRKAYHVALERVKESQSESEPGGFDIEETDLGLAIRLSDLLMFERGNTDLRPEVLPLLDLIAELIILRPGKVSIVGNTCDLPISTYQFPSNWELSMGRAINVLHHLEGVGAVPDSMFAYGLADQNPLVPNDSEASRCVNRRVEIYVTYNNAGGSIWDDQDEDQYGEDSGE